MPGQRTFPPEIFEKSRDFQFFFRFFYEARRSAVFQSTCQKCMSVDSSILPLSESILFRKQMKILMQFLKKKSLSTSHTLWHDFSDIRFLKVALRVAAFHSLFFYATEEKGIFLKKRTSC